MLSNAPCVSDSLENILGHHDPVPARVPSFNLQTGSTNVFYNGRCVTVESMHGGIEPSIIAAKLEDADIAVRVAELRKQYEGRYVFVGIDKVQENLPVPGGLGCSGGFFLRSMSIHGILRRFFPSLNQWHSDNLAVWTSRLLTEPPSMDALL